MRGLDRYESPEMFVCRQKNQAERALPQESLDAIAADGPRQHRRRGRLLLQICRMTGRFVRGRPLLVDIPTRGRHGMALPLAMGCAPLKAWVYSNSLAVKCTKRVVQQNARNQMVNALSAFDARQ